MGKTKIEWCDYTINPVVGCTYGCEYCYARKLNNRFKFIEDWSKPQFKEERLEMIGKIKKKSNVFMNSMSDIADWKKEWFEKVFNSIDKNNKSKSNFLFLTKRPNESILEEIEYINSYDNIFERVWFGYSYVGGKDKNLYNSKYVGNFYYSFLSIEPLLEKPYLSGADCKHCDWFIIGAETGNRKNKVIPKKEWVDDIVKYAREHDIYVFMKDSLIPIVGEENMLREYPFTLEVKDRKWK